MFFYVCVFVCYSLSDKKCVKPANYEQLELKTNVMLTFDLTYFYTLVTVRRLL